MVKKDAIKSALKEETANSKTRISRSSVKKVRYGEETVVSIVDELVKKALLAKASDIHIEPRENDVVVRYRIDGILREVMQLEKKLEQGLVFRIKVASKLRTDQHYAPQDGRIRFIFDGKNLDTRISILPTTKGEKIVIRLLSQEGKSFALSELGFGEKNLFLMEKSYTKPYGMILATGPTGSGKTTTLYSILQIVNSSEKNITTIEDPVEYEINGVNHIQINSKADLTFASGLRSILRQDPDIVMVGEIRDSETARIAINAAMTGHLVLSTLHTNDAVTAIPRLVDMGVEAYLVAGTVSLIIAQRLGRKLCEKCKKAYTLSKEEKDNLERMRPDISLLLKIGEPLFKEVGCEECNMTGFKGRIGLYELLEINKNIRELIVRGGNADILFSEARKMGLILIVEDGVNKLKMGILSISELIRITALKE